MLQCGDCVLQCVDGIDVVRRGAAQARDVKNV
jgi:hypothetical protein